MSHTRAMALCVCLAAQLALPRGSALAQSDPLARDLKQQGDEAMEGGEYAEALSRYTRASAIEPTAALHYNRGRALQALERYAEALEALERFESEASAELRARVQNLDSLLATLRARVGTLSVQANVPEATLRVGDERAYGLPVEKLKLDAGQHWLRVTATGFEPVQREVLVQGGEHQQLRFTLVTKDERAVLRVQSPVTGAEVWLGEEAVGHVPLELSLEPGSHQLTLKHPDYRTTQTRVVLEPHEQRNLDVAMERPPRLYQRWWFWTGVALIAGGVVAGAVLATRPQDPTPGDIPPGVLVVPNGSR